MKWFGKSWGAPACNYGEHVETPVGALCMECERTIREGDDGLLLPHIEYLPVAPNPAPPRVTEKPWHRQCFLKNVLGEQGGAQ